MFGTRGTKPTHGPPRTFHLILLLLSVAMTGLGLLAFAEAVFYFQEGQRYAPAGNLCGEEGAEQKLYREPIPRQRDSRIRIVTVGGSTTYGYELPPGGAWPEQLRARLEASHPGRYEIINLGQIGGHLEGFLLDFEAVTTRFISREAWLRGERPLPCQRAAWGWKELRPDVVLLAPVVNDTAPDYLAESETGALGQAALRGEAWLGASRLGREWALGHYLRQALTLAAFKDRRPRAGEEARLAILRARYRNNLTALATRWQGHTRLCLLGLPLLFSATDPPQAAERAASYWNISDPQRLRSEMVYLPRLEKLEQEVRAEVAATLDLPHREIGADLRAERFPRRLRLYLDAIHTNTEGADRVADEVAAFLPRCMAGLPFSPPDRQGVAQKNDTP